MASGRLHIGNRENSWLFGQQDIEKRAFDLSGMAHVGVEPDRAFSFDLRDETGARNANGGTVDWSVPGQGIVMRHYFGWQIQNGHELAATIRSAASALRSQMPPFGWDWTELQEQALRAQRERVRNSLTAAENETLSLDEIENLRNRIGQPEQQLSTCPAASLGTDEAEFSTDNLVRRIGPEVYLGEISDRLRFAAKTTLAGLPFGAYANGFTQIDPRFDWIGATTDLLTARIDIGPARYADIVYGWVAGVPPSSAGAEKSRPPTSPNLPCA